MNELIFNFLARRNWKTPP